MSNNFVYNGGYRIDQALLDIGSSVNLLSYSVYKELGLGELKPTRVTLELADRSIKVPRGIIEDVLIQVDTVYYPIDFIILDTLPVEFESSKRHIESSSAREGSDYVMYVSHWILTFEPLAPSAVKPIISEKQPPIRERKLLPSILNHNRI